MEKDLKLNEDIRNGLARAAVLYMMLERGSQIDSSLNGPNRALREIMEEGEGKTWVVNKKKYEVTLKGELLWENWKARWWDFLVNFDIHAGVDLQEGKFADDEADWDLEDENGNLIWEDLRVAVCLRKMELAAKEGKMTGLNPFAVTFLALLSEGRLEQSREWQFDIAYDSIFWTEIQNIVNASVWPQELGYDDVPWEEVMDDIIAQGMKASRQRWEEDEDEEGENEDNILPSEAFSSENQVMQSYEQEIVEYGYKPGFFYYSPYWQLGSSAVAVGAVGLCWAQFQP